jgi:hypothetical protein
MAIVKAHLGSLEKGFARLWIILVSLKYLPLGRFSWVVERASLGPNPIACQGSDQRLN